MGRAEPQWQIGEPGTADKVNCDLGAISWHAIVSLQEKAPFSIGNDTPEQQDPHYQFLSSLERCFVEGGGDTSLRHARRLYAPEGSLLLFHHPLVDC